MLSYQSIKPLLFKLDPETAHNIAEKALHILGEYVAPLNSYLSDKNFIDDGILNQKIFNKDFYNPVGLGAGFDKNATMIRAMLGLGFGFSEIGTITPKPQSGNPKPRLFRHIEEKSLQNAFGFNNDGAFAVEKRVQKLYPFATPIGINIGKNKLTSQENALDDYLFLAKTFKDMADYMVINISSPNTPNLRDLQNQQFIKELFDALKTVTTKPILLKIAPDMSVDTAISLCDTAIKNGASGIIATNTSIDYSLVKNPKDIGGISGQAIEKKSKEMFRAIAKELFGKSILISVGGIGSAKEAYSRIRLGANLIQVYSMLIYEGPSLIKKINLELIELLKQDGFNHISEAIGVDL